jgi:hypothetical protein
MRSNVLSLVILGVVTGLSFAADVEKTTSVELEDLTWLIGEWKGEYNLPEGFPELGPAGAHVVSTNSFRRTLGELGRWFFGSRGFHGSGIWSRTGDVWSIKWQSFEPDDKKIEGVSDHVRIDADTFTWQMRDIKENGKDIPDWPKVTYRRKLAAPPGENDLWMAYRAAAAGNWNGTGALIQAFPDLGLDKGDKFRMQFSLEPQLDGKALVGKTEFEMLDGPFKAQCRVLAGWDPDTRQVRVLAFWSGGLVEEIVLVRQRGTAFYGTYTAKSPSSRTLRGRICQDFDTPDSYVFTFLDGALEGQTLSSFERHK